MDTKSVAITALYMGQGAEEALQAMKTTPEGSKAYDDLSDRLGGHIGIMGDLIDFAELSETILGEMGEQDFPGVYDYEVSEPFGTWWVGAMQEPGYTHEDAKKQLRQMIEDFFKQGDAPSDTKAKWLVEAEQHMLDKFGIGIDDTGNSDDGFYDQWSHTDPLNAVLTFGEKYGLTLRCEF